jgi:hypothetical protein
LKPEILAHVRCYNVTTRDVVARLYFDGDAKAASAALRDLVADGELYRHGKVFRRSRHRPEPQQLHRDLALLAYCCLAEGRRPLLSRDELERVLQPVLDHLKFPPPSASVRCIIDDQRRLSLVRVQRLMRGRGLPDLNRELVQLQSLVEDKAFRPWAFFAREERFSLTYLLHGPDQVSELALWTQRRPLVSRALREPVVVPLVSDAIPKL